MSHKLRILVIDRVYNCIWWIILSWQVKQYSLRHSLQKKHRNSVYLHWDTLRKLIDQLCMGNENFIFQIFSVFEAAYTYKRYVKEKQKYYCYKNEYENEVEKGLHGSGYLTTLLRLWASPVWTRHFPCKFIQLHQVGATVWVKAKNGARMRECNPVEPGRVSPLSIWNSTGEGGRGCRSFWTPPNHRARKLCMGNPGDFCTSQSLGVVLWVQKKEMQQTVCTMRREPFGVYFTLEMALEEFVQSIPQGNPYGGCHIEQAEITALLLIVQVCLCTIHWFHLLITFLNLTAWVEHSPCQVSASGCFYFSVWFYVSVLGFWHFQLAPFKRFWEQDQRENKMLCFVEMLHALK